MTSRSATLTPSPGSRDPSAGNPRDAGARSDRLLPYIAAERIFRALVLVAIGLVLITHPHTDWGRTISDLAKHFGFDPSRNGIEKVIAKVQAISPNKYEVYGAIAIGYGVLEGVEGYGLWRRRRWGEYLTVVVTALLFIPEILELTKTVTVGKVAALVVNIAIVAYLVFRLRRYGG